MTRALLPAIPALSGCVFLARDFPARMDFPIRDAAVYTPPPDSSARLRVMAWNVKYGAGRIDFWFDTWGDTVIMEADTVEANLAAVRAQVRAFQPDVLMVSEIEVGSKRSAYIDMVDVLLNDPTLGFNHAAYVPNWDVEYVPDNGLGKVDMGNAVFSRWPITRNTRVDLGPIEEQDALTQYFYLDRNMQRVHIDLPTGPLVVLNNHPDAYSTDGTKLRQVQQIFDEALTVDEDLIVGGDLNCVPPGSLRLSGFADDPTEAAGRGTSVVDYIGEEDVLQPWFDTWEEALEEDKGDGRLSFAAYAAATDEAAQAEWFTHSIKKDVRWTRRLDYLFANAPWEAGWVVGDPDDGPDGPTGPALPDPMTLSDHAAVWGVLVLE
jgi:endonuclease/exonuclease/phosphatase family metal-dependent hydrolase